MAGIPTPTFSGYLQDFAFSFFLLLSLPFIFYANFPKHDKKRSKKYKHDYGKNKLYGFPYIIPETSALLSLLFLFPLFHIPLMPFFSLAFFFSDLPQLCAHRVMERIRTFGIILLCKIGFKAKVKHVLYRTCGQTVLQSSALNAPIVFLADYHQ